MKINTLCILGTCSDAIKMAPVIQRLESDPRFHKQIAVLDQGHQGLQALCELFHIQPDYQWQIEAEPRDLARLNAKILLVLTELFAQYRPHYVLVLGDTVTAFSAALAAHYYHIPIGHIEAGLRTGDNELPWPQEIHRKLIGDMASAHFAPTFLARQNLLREGKTSDAIYVTGSTTMDALFEMLTHIRKNPDLQLQFKQQFGFLNPARRMILVSGPQYDLFGEKLKNVCQALLTIAQRFPDVNIVYSVGIGSQAQQFAHDYLANMENIILIDAMDYAAFVYLMQNSYVIITDSGGIQEEAPSLGKPVLLLRDKTERPEAIDAGTVILVGTDIEKIVFETTRLLKNQNHYQQMSQAISPYGDGKAASRIVDALAKHHIKHVVHQEKDLGLIPET